jgi:hypothetical protein
LFRLPPEEEEEEVVVVVARRRRRRRRRRRWWWRNKPFRIFQLTKQCNELSSFTGAGARAGVK